jgi:hypothetical protein
MKYHNFRTVLKNREFNIYQSFINQKGGITMRQESSTLKGALVVMAIFAVMMFQPTMSIAGPLDPPTSAVDASGNPVSTTPEIPSWSRKIDGPERFVLVLDGDGVLDRETGLVWEQSPIASTFQWRYAQEICSSRSFGRSGRRGWHGPTIAQLASLLDLTVSSSPKLPIGHPFDNVQSGMYWSTTTWSGDNSQAFLLSIYTGTQYGSSKTESHYIWCVRGGQSNDGY